MTTRRVYKYPLGPLGDWITVQMPDKAEVLCVQVQNGVTCLWARVTVGGPPVIRHFRVAGTGHGLGEELGRYVGTIQLHGGSLVFHVFEDGA